mgnify:FL=1
MKKHVYFVLLVILISGCSVNKQPIFLKVDNIKVISAVSDTIRLKAEAFFKNPNDVGGNITTDDIKVIVNDAEVAQVFSSKFNVPARKEFIMPLYVIIPTKRIFENNKNGILGGLLNAVLNKSVKVQFKGNLEYRYLVFKRDFVVNHIQEIKL